MLYYKFYSAMIVSGNKITVSVSGTAELLEQMKQ